MTIVPVGVDAQGNINIAELRQKAEANKDRLAALMITYPSTHGVYEEGVDEICRIIHDNGGQVCVCVSARVCVCVGGGHVCVHGVACTAPTACLPACLPSPSPAHCLEAVPARRPSPQPGSILPPCHPAFHLTRSLTHTRPPPCAPRCTWMAPT